MLSEPEVVANINFSKDSAKKIYEFADRFKMFVIATILASVLNLIAVSLKIADILNVNVTILGQNAEILIKIATFFIEYILVLVFFFPAFSRFNRFFVIKQHKTLHLSRIFMLISFVLSCITPIISRLRFNSAIAYVMSSIFVLTTISFNILTWWSFTRFLKTFPSAELNLKSYQLGFRIYLFSSIAMLLPYIAIIIINFIEPNHGYELIAFFFYHLFSIVAFIGLLKSVNFVIDVFSEKKLQRILPPTQRGEQQRKTKSKVGERIKNILFLIPAYIALIVFVFLPIAFAFIISVFENPSTVELSNFLQYYFNFPSAGTFLGNLTTMYSEMISYVVNRPVGGLILLIAFFIYFVIQFWWLVNRRFKKRRMNLSKPTRIILSIVLGLIVGSLAFFVLIFVFTRFNLTNLSQSDILSFFLLPPDISYSYKGVLYVNGIILLTSVLLMIFYTRFVYRKLEKYIKQKLPRIGIAFLTSLVTAPLTLFVVTILLYYVGVYIVLPIKEFQRVISIQSLNFMRIFFNSFFWTLTCTALHVIIGVALAVVLNRSFPGRSVARSLLILPWAVPSFVSTLMWRAYVFDDDLGFLGNLAKTFPESYVFTTAHLLSFAIGIAVAIILAVLLIRAINKSFKIPPLLKSIINFVIIIAGFFVGGVIISLLMRSLGTVDVGLFGYKILDIPQIIDSFWITDSVYIFGIEFKMITFSAILINVWLGVPFMMLSFLATLQSIPKDLYEAADIDGLTGWDKFRRITLPLLKPTLLTVSLLGIIWTFNLFNVVYILSQNQNGLGDSTKYDIFVTFIYERFSRAQPQYSQAAALSITVFFILVSFSLVYRRLIKAEKIWEGEEK